MSRGICKICKRFFEKTETNQDICPECYYAEFTEYQIVKEYLTKHRGASLWEVSTNTGVSVKKISHFIGDGKIEIINEIG